jgi:S-adenosylmethionine:tRNA ribosyltransferase-isomerase
VEGARARKGRVVAVGTSVVRALEASAARGGRVLAGAGVAELRVGPGFRPRVVNGLLTGVHEPGSSHHALLGAFVGADLLARAARRAERKGYLIHEFGDSWLVLAA